MQSLVRTIAVIAISSLLLVACAPAAPTVAPTTASKAAATSAPSGAATTPVATKPAAPAASPTPTAKIKRGGTLVHAYQWTYPTMDPHLSTASEPPGTVMLFDYLVRHQVVDNQSGKSEAKPELAESWETTDPKTIVLKLRRGVKFQDGSEWNAEVAKWNLDRIRTHAKSQGKTRVEAIASVDVVDPNTIKINLKEPSAAQMALLTRSAGGVTMAMISKAAVDKDGDEKFGNSPVGSGPMKFTRWVRDDRLELERWDGYWQMGADGKPLPYIDKFVDRFIQDAAVTQVELKAGTIHMTYNVEGKDIAGIKSNPDLVYLELPWTGPIYFTAGFNGQKGPFFGEDRLKLRQAALTALDRQSMANALGFGIGKPWYYPHWGPGTPGYDTSIPKYEYNLDKAKQLLAEAGYPNGIDINLMVISRSEEIRISEIVKSMWDRAGIRTTLETWERLAWIDKSRAGDFHVSFWRGSMTLEPDALMNSYGCGAAGNWNNWCSKAEETCLLEGRREYDPNKRHEIYKKCLTIVQEEAYMGSSFTMPGNVVYRKEVKGIEPQWGSPLFFPKGIWLDK